MAEILELEKIKTDVVELAKEYGAENVFLFGSYARGDYDNESDIDIVALVRCDRETISEKTLAMARFSSDLDLEYGVMVSPSAIPYDEYLKYQNDLPYYANIAKEGVELIA